MSRRLRVLVALATVAAMLLSLAGFASAQFEDVDEDAAYADDVEFLYELGITTGISATEFGPDQTLTRQQFAVFVTRAQKQSALADSFANWRTNFTDDADIAPWARGAVYLASSSGIINGYPDGSFKPNNPVTVAEALTMLVRALGFKTYAESKGGFPAGYLIVAQELGLTDGLTLTAANLPMQRWEMAVALVNALNATRAKNDDGSPNFDAADANSWLSTLWDREPEFVYEGKIERILTSSDRIQVGDRTFDYDNKTVVSLNNVEQTDGPNDPRTVEEAASGTSPLLDEDVLVAVTYDGDYAKEINVLANTLENEDLTDVSTEEGETDFGEITVNSVDLEVDDETVILLNGKKVSLAELEEAFDDFQDEWDDAPAIATVRVEGEDNPAALGGGERAVYVSVITNKIVEGEIDRIGSDSKGDYARIDGEKVYYEGITANPGDEVVWLLDHDDVARVALDEITAAGKFFAILDSVEKVDTNEWEVILELADESTRTVTVGANPISGSVQAGDVVWVEIDSSGNVTIADAETQPKQPGSGAAKVLRKTSTSIAVDLDGGNDIDAGETFPVAADGVFVLEGDDVERYSAVAEGENVILYFTDDGEVGYITVQ